MQSDGSLCARRWMPVWDSLVRIIVRNQLFQSYQGDEKDAHHHTRRCGGYPEDQILRHCLLPARFSGTIAQARGDGCPEADVYVFGIARANVALPKHPNSMPSKKPSAYGLAR
jgi:hypothetical protein